jgi:uncharacterized membrane protein
MAAPFPEAVIAPIIYFFLGVLTLAVLITAYYLKRLLEGREEEKPSVDAMGLSHRAERVLETVLEEPELQSDLPDALEVSKSTVSQAVSELHDRDFIKKKKKGNTYLIEPKVKRIREEN